MLNRSFWVDVVKRHLTNINPKAPVLSFTSFRMTIGGRMGLGCALGHDTRSFTSFRMTRGALPHITEETFNGFGDLNGAVHGGRKLDTFRMLWKADYECEKSYSLKSWTGR